MFESPWGAALSRNGKGASQKGRGKIRAEVEVSDWVLNTKGQLSRHPSYGRLLRRARQGNGAVMCRITAPYETVLHQTRLCFTVLYCTVLDCTVLTVQLYAVNHCNVLYCAVLYCTVLYCTVLYSIPTSREWSMRGMASCPGEIQDRIVLYCNVL